MGDVLQFRRKRGRDGTCVQVRVDGEVVSFTVEDNGRPVLEMACCEESARGIAEQLLNAAHTILVTRRNAREHAEGSVTIALMGTGRDGGERWVSWCRATVTARDPFVTTLRVEETVNGLSHQRHAGIEVRVRTATGEDVSRKPGRRWWQVTKEHVARLRLPVTDSHETP